MSDLLIFAIAFAVLAALTMIRLAKGPTAADRMVAGDAADTLICVALVLFSLFSGRGIYLDIALVAAIFGVIDAACDRDFYELLASVVPARRRSPLFGARAFSTALTPSNNVDELSLYDGGDCAFYPSFWRRTPLTRDGRLRSSLTGSLLSAQYNPGRATVDDRRSLRVSIGFRVRMRLRVKRR